MTDRLTPEREAEIAAAVAELDADRMLAAGCWTASPVDEKSMLPPELAFAVEDVVRMESATIRGSVGVFGDERHAAFAALARTAVSELLAELAAVRAERDRLQVRFDELEALGRELLNHCTAEYGGPGYTHCELQAGHEGQHESAIGHMRRATWGGVR